MHRQVQSDPGLLLLRARARARAWAALGGALRLDCSMTSGAPCPCLSHRPDKTKECQIAFLRGRKASSTLRLFVNVHILHQMWALQQ